MKLMTALGAILLGTSVVAVAPGTGRADTNSSIPPMLITETTTPQMYCLAMNIYHEARSDNLAGKAAVADVVLNRVNDKRYPSTICDVVHQGPISKWHKENSGKEVPLRNKCQFSWYCDGKSDDPKNKDAWEEAKIIAYNMVKHGRYRGITEGATHYHASYITPSWAEKLSLIGKIGEHIFYRAL